MRQSLGPVPFGHGRPDACATFTTPPVRMWQFLYFLPLPQGQGSLRPTRWPRLRIGSGFSVSLVGGAGLLLALLVLLGRAGRFGVRGARLDPGRADEFFVELLDLEDVLRGPVADVLPHLVEELHPFALVLDLGIDLGIAHQADRAAQPIHHQQVVFPGRIDDLQQQHPLHPPHLGAVAIVHGIDQLLLQLVARQIGDLVGLERRIGASGRTRQRANRSGRWRPPANARGMRGVGRCRTACRAACGPRRLPPPPFAGPPCCASTSTCADFVALLALEVFDVESSPNRSRAQATSPSRSSRAD